MRKREKFLVSSFVLSFALLGTQYVPLDFRLLGTALLFFVTYAMSAWALFDDLGGIEWFMVVPFPCLYAISVSLFYFLLPENILSKIAVLALFGVGMYAIYLTCNIFSVAKFRTIQLLRAAHAVSFLFTTLLIEFFFANTIFSLHLPFWANGLAISLATFPLVLISLWSIELKQKLDISLLHQAITVAVLMGELAIGISFLPTTLWAASLCIVGSMYAVLGVLVTKLSGRLFQNTVWEYVGVWIVMLLAFFAMVQWK
ncbi:MAG: hypothetical protein AAB612_00595 [Patescibacteria group bacterium]